MNLLNDLKFFHDFNEPLDCVNCLLIDFLTIPPAQYIYIYGINDLLVAFTRDCDL